MQAYLIDPRTREISEVDVPEGDREFLEEAYRLLECDLIEAAVVVGSTDVVYVDESGLLRQGRWGHFFRVKGNPNYLVGRGLVVGTDEGGGATDPLETLSAFRERVSWLGAGRLLT